MPTERSSANDTAAVATQTNETDGTTASLNRVSTALSDDAVEVTACLDGRPLQVLLDSGADISCISSECWKRLQFDKTLQPSTVTYGVTANDTALKFDGHVRLPISIGDAEVEHSFHICCGLTHDCLLGRDFMQQHNGILDFDSNEFSFDETVSVNTVTVAEKTVVPENCELDVICRLPKTNTLLGTVVFEPNDDLPGLATLSAATSVSRLNKDSRLLYVRFVNTSSEDVTLKRGVPIGCVRKILPKNIRQIKIPDEAKKPKTSMPVEDFKFPKYDSNVLNDDQKKRVDDLFEEFRDIFSQGPGDIGQTDVVQHEIDTGSQEPIKAMPRRVPMHRRETLETMIKEMEQNKVVRKSDSAWASPIVLAPKKDGTLRFCVDFRALNAVTRKDAYPLPRIDDILETLQDVKYFCHLDLASGYWQVKDYTNF
jgi:hypothetical protein